MPSDLKSKLTSRTLAIIGIVLILVGNLFSYVILNVKIHELVSNVGALILVVGVLQWFFDEESRENLINRISSHIEIYLSRRDNITRLGASECTTDSKSIVSGPWASELIEAQTLVIGIHYSDSVIVRLESIIRARMAQNKITQILYSDPNGLAKGYLEKCLSVPVDLEKKVNRLKHLVATRFEGSDKLRMISHGRVLRYSFICSEQAIWLIFLTNSDGYEPALPALRVTMGTPLFEFFKRDIVDLGANL